MNFTGYIKEVCEVRFRNSAKGGCGKGVVKVLEQTENEKERSAEYSLVSYLGIKQRVLCRV